IVVKDGRVGRRRARESRRRVGIGVLQAQLEKPLGPARPEEMGDIELARARHPPELAIEVVAIAPREGGGEIGGDLRVVPQVEDLLADGWIGNEEFAVILMNL